MKKKLLYTALWLMCGIVLPLSTSAYDNWIYTWVNESWDINVIWNDTTRWNINLTIAWSDLDSYYGYVWWGNSICLQSSYCTHYTWPTYNNRWWWSWDTAANWYSPNPTNYDERKWPCGTWYHVPSRWEWNALFIAWCNIDENCNARYSDEIKGGVTWDLRKNSEWTESNKLISINNSTLWDRFRQIFNMDTNYIWSSSPYSGGNDMSAWYMNPFTLILTWNQRGNTFGVRCFKNPPIKTLIFHPNGWTFSWMVVDDTQKVVFTKDDNKYIPDINIQFPNREWYMFDGWYTSATQQTPANEWTGYVSDDTTVTDVYAKWLGFEPYDVKDDNWNTLFTIMDRNLWATTTGTTCSSSNLPACGKLFQWWNNYGFDNSTSPWPYRTGSASVQYTDLVDASAYGPWNYYSSSTFILRPDGSDYYRWDKTDNANLWWWEWDTATTRWPGTDADRQWPCPVNYHVPSTLEWKSAYNLLWLTASAEWVTKLQTKLQLPFAGYRSRWNSNVYYRGSYGNYWSSTHSNGNSAYNLYFDSSYIAPQRYDYRSYAFSVRCFKDSPTQTLTFVREDAGTVDSKEVYWYEPIIESSYKPSAPAETTETWYTDENRTQEFIFWDTAYVTQAKTLYSKVTCSDPSSNWNGAECEAPKNTVTFDYSTNWWTSTTSWSIQVTSWNDLNLSLYTWYKEGWDFVWWNTISWATTAMTNPTITEPITLYAIFSKTLTGTYTATNATISWNLASDTCTMYNNDTSCSITLPSVTCDAWYHTPTWSPANLDDISSDVWATVSCTPNDDTQYLVHYYQQNLSWAYDLFETYTWAWTTDTIATAVEKTYSGFAFSWTNTNNKLTWNIDGDGSLELKLYYDRGEYKLSFVVDGNVVQSGTVAYAAAITAPADPTKDCNAFAGWSSSVAWVTTAWTMPDSDVTFTANWNYTCSRSSGWGWWGRTTSPIDVVNETLDNNVQNTTDEKENGENVDNVDNTEGNKSWETVYSDEFKEAYEFAHSQWITTMPTIQQADMESPLTRIAMAKMLSYYAINVLWQKPDTSKTIKFKDVSNKLNTQYDNWVILAYQLWIMWINMPKNRFRPNDPVTRWEFGTALSRMLYKIADWKKKYYSTHLAKLMEEKIITNDNPDMKELRGYVMIMLKRSAENK